MRRKHVTLGVFHAAAVVSKRWQRTLLMPVELKWYGKIRVDSLLTWMLYGFLLARSEPVLLLCMGKAAAFGAHYTSARALV